MLAFNPYLPSWEYVPDGEPRVFGDRLYVYGSHDLFNGTDFCEGDYVLWSAPVSDLGAWRCDGVIYRKTQDPKNTDGSLCVYAPDCVRGTDGRYYLYYQLNRMTFTSVAVADRPEGPFAFYGYVRHPDGTPWGMKPGDVFAFDPGALVDDDGHAWLYVGFSPWGMMKTRMQARGNHLDGAVCLKLEKDMITVTGGEKLIVPGHDLAAGTAYEGHAFYEASSMRRIGDHYCFVYSSELSHELCYALSDRPDGGFRYGGTLVSIGDIGLNGRKDAVNYLGNTHGGLAEINGKWYVFYHRQTNRQKCARQGCAEEITILPDGRIPQVEVTSCGLNGGPLPGEGVFEARIACHLRSAEGTFPYTAAHEPDEKQIHPYFTQSGVDREGNGDQYIAHMTDGATAGFKYFELSGKTGVSVLLRGTGEGKMLISTSETGAPACAIDVRANSEWSEFHEQLEALGKNALFFTFKGTGYVDFDRLILKPARS